MTGSTDGWEAVEHQIFVILCPPGRRQLSPWSVPASHWINLLSRCPEAFCSLSFLLALSSCLGNVFMIAVGLTPLFSGSQWLLSHWGEVGRDLVNLFSLTAAKFSWSRIKSIGTEAEDYLMIPSWDRGGQIAKGKHPAGKYFFFQTPLSKRVV